MTESTNIRRAAVIMAGGAGERFWPLSRQHYPKQLLRLTSADKTMLEEAIDRARPLIPVEDIYIQTMPHLVAAIREAGTEVAPENVLAEPCKRNTSGCLAYAAAHLLAKYGGDGSEITMAVLTSDHVIGELDKFRATIDLAMRAAETQDALLTVGVAPTRPATGYGYIHAGPAGEEGVRPVLGFKEKPAREVAEQYLDSGDYYWNSGMFFWRISTFLSELDQARPALADATRQMAEAMRAGDEARVNAVFEGLEDISIDYALMEKARNVAMAPANFPWDDVGAWAALDRTREHDDRGNVAHGGPVLVDCEGSIVYNALGADRMAVAVVGMKDVIVVATDDGVLVVPKGRAEEVKDAVKTLKDRDAPQL